MSEQPQNLEAEAATALAVCEAATPGPWSFGREQNGNQIGCSWFPFDKGHEIFPPSQAEAGLDYQPGGPVAMVSDGEFENTVFIALSRTATPLWIERWRAAEAARLAAEHERDKAKAALMVFLRDCTDGMECLPECDSYAHAELCPVTNTAAAWRQLRVERDEARRAAIELLRLYARRDDDYVCYAAEAICDKHLWLKEADHA